MWNFEILPDLAFDMDLVFVAAGRHPCFSKHMSTSNGYVYFVKEIYSTRTKKINIGYRPKQQWCSGKAKAVGLQLTWEIESKGLEPGSFHCNR